jgi:hypothetical protein
MAAPLALSDSQITAIWSASRPMQPQEREAFLGALGAVFQGRDSVGDGELYRAIRELQRTHFRAPVETERHEPRRQLKAG